MKGLTMTTTHEKALTTLTEKFGQKDWFHSVEVDPLFGKDLGLYARYMNAEVLNEVPSKCEDTRVVLSYAAYKEVAPTVIDISLPKSFLTELTAPIPVVEKTEIVDVADIEKIIAPTKPFTAKEDVSVTIERLTKQCGKSNLKNVFWELRDIENKEKPCTNFSAEFPKVKEELGKLYTEYGFDALFDLLQ